MVNVSFTVSDVCTAVLTNFIRGRCLYIPRVLSCEHGPSRGPEPNCRAKSEVMVEQMPPTFRKLISFFFSDWPHAPPLVLLFNFGDML